MHLIKRAYDAIRTHTTRFFRICFALLLLSWLLLLAATLSTPVADALNGTLCHAVRVGLGRLTSLVPFSVGELLLFLIPTGLTFAIAWVVVRAQTRAARLRCLSCVLAVVCLVLSMQTLTLGIAYRAAPVDRALSLTRQNVTAEELLHVAERLRDEAQATLDDITFDENGSSVMPYDIPTMNEKLMQAYACVDEQYPDLVQHFPTRIKPVTASRIMSYMHIIGVYTFFSGDANLNVDYPDCHFPATAAHELAHQRGIAPEDAANFVAHLVCMASDDPYIRYSGCTRLLIYVTNAYYRAAGTDAYRAFYATVDARIRREFQAESEHSAQFDTAFGDFSSGVNDLYLKVNGTDGAVSYGLVVDLAVAYYKQQD